MTRLMVKQTPTSRVFSVLVATTILVLSANCTKLETEIVGTWEGSQLSGTRTNEITGVRLVVHDDGTMTKRSTYTRSPGNPIKLVYKFVSSNQMQVHQFFDAGTVYLWTLELNGDVLRIEIDEQVPRVYELYRVKG